MLEGEDLKTTFSEVEVRSVLLGRWPTYHRLRSRSACQHSADEDEAKPEHGQPAGRIVGRSRKNVRSVPGSELSTKSIGTR
jgi:hypothetical protein